MKKSKFSNLFLVTALLLMVLPFITTFNEFLTSIFLKWEAYRFLEEIVVPYQARVLAAIFQIFQIPAAANLKGIWLGQTFLEIQWNCLGWQSGVLLLATFLTGFQGKFSAISRFEVIVIGVLGTYLVNLARILIVGGFVAGGAGKTAALIFHDWFSLVFVILWFFGFWWFSYSFVLEER